MTDSSERSEHVRSLLRELHQTLADSEPIDASLEAPLRETLHEVEHALERAHAQGADLDESGLSEKVERLALEFETAHPLLAGLINRLTNQLASLGF